MKTETIRDVLCEINDFYGTGSDLEISEVLKMAEIARLDRIANALENLNQEVGCISASIPDLEECIDEYGRFCVTGTMTSFVG